MPACFAPATSGKAQRQLIAKSRIVRRIPVDAGTGAPMLYVPKVKLNLLLLVERWMEIGARGTIGETQNFASLTGII
jgi:hypothetical protein